MFEQRRLADAAGHDGAVDAGVVQGADHAAELADLDPGDGVDLALPARAGVSPSWATATTSTPAARAVRAKINGKRPLPAMSPTRCIASLSKAEKRKGKSDTLCRFLRFSLQPLPTGTPLARRIG